MTPRFRCDWMAPSSPLSEHDFLVNALQILMRRGWWVRLDIAGRRKSLPAKVNRRWLARLFARTAAVRCAQTCNPARMTYRTAAEQDSELMASPLGQYPRVIVPMQRDTRPHTVTDRGRWRFSA